MLESKSNFARRIKKTLPYVAYHVKRGNVVLNERGYVRVEESQENLRKVKPGRPKLPRTEKKVAITLYVPRRQVKVLKSFIKELR